MSNSNEFVGVWDGAISSGTPPPGIGATFSFTIDSEQAGTITGSFTNHNHEHQPLVDGKASGNNVEFTVQFSPYPAERFKGKLVATNPKKRIKGDVRPTDPKAMDPPPSWDAEARNPPPTENSGFPR